MCAIYMGSEVMKASGARVKRDLNDTEMLEKGQ
jgi:hypothetical protein